MAWALPHTVRTPAGKVAWGSEGAGPPLVLAHGWPWSSFTWHRLIPELAQHFTLYWYDMPGYGRSEMRQDQRTGLDVQGEVFAFLLEHWGLDRPSVFAHDFGGATTLRVHLLLGCDFERYILMNVVAMRPWGSAFFDHVARHVDAFTGLPPHIHEAVVRAYIKGALARGIEQDDFEALVVPWLSEKGRGSFYRQFAQADERFTAEVEPLYGSVGCPTLILWGAQDPWIPLERRRALHATMPNADFEVLADAGHLPQLEAPDRVLAHALPFLVQSSKI
ncbi:MAG: alpha/beta hydrolase [Pseudomonadota bacterium]